MKQLKFMLAAATAIGIAAAAQAATKTLESENFNTYSTEKNITGENGIDGFTFVPGEGESQSDNESAIVANPNGVQGDMSLSVNTGTSPLLRQIRDEEGGIVNLANINHLEIDTLVQFTVTPWSDKDNVTPTDGLDKLMIYLQEDFSDEANPVTNLVVKAGYLGESLIKETYKLDLGDLEITTNAWYRLKVRAYANVGDPTMAENFGTYPGFSISVGPEDAETLIDAKIANGKCYSDSDTSFGPLVFNEQSPHGTDLAAGKIFLSMVNSTQLTHVGFAGEGMVDNFVVTKDYNVSSVDFTFTWSETKISAVKYAIGDDELAPLENKTLAGLAPDAVIKIQIEPADWYAVKEDADLEFSASEATADLDGLVTKLTSKVDPETGDVVINPDDSVTVAQIQEAAGITGGAFYDANTSKADLEKVLTWKKNKGGANYNINNIAFGVPADQETDDTKAYLLNCSKDELATEIAKFKFAGFDPAAGTFKVGSDKMADDKAAYGNGYVEVRGSSTVNGAYTEAADNSKHYFFKAFLVPFAPVAE